MPGTHPLGQTLIASLVSIFVACSTAVVGANPLVDEPQSFALYATTANGTIYRLIDPMSLATIDDAQALVFGHEWPHLAVSVDGSTAVTIDHAEGPLDGWIVIHDGIGGAVRRTITPPGPVFNPRLSADGSRLVAEPSLMCGPSGCGERTWYSWDTRTGALLAATRADLGAPVWPDLMDPEGRRLSYPYQQPPVWTSTSTPVPGEPSQVGPWPLRIASFDLATGREVARMTVPDVLAGSWQAPPIDGMYVGGMLLPAVALSPDGSTIAVVDAAMEQLTLIEAGTLTVIDTVAIEPVQSGWDQVLDWLGLAPHAAQAKVSEGRSLRATWAADGEHLYVTGHKMGVGDTVDDVTGHGLGLNKVDVATGEITHAALAGHDPDMVMPAPDGRSLYVVMPERPWWEDGAGSAYMVRRLDAFTLETMAERRFDSWAPVVIAPLRNG